MGKPQVPLEERMSAIGQWGPLVGAFFALFAAVMKKTVDELTAMRDKNRRNAIDVELTASIPAERHPVTLTPADFQEGVFWGHGSNNLRFTHQEIKWVVLDGFLRRDDEQAEI